MLGYILCLSTMVYPFSLTKDFYEVDNYAYQPDRTVPWTNIMISVDFPADIMDHDMFLAVARCPYDQTHSCGTSPCSYADGRPCDFWDENSHGYYQLSRPASYVKQDSGSHYTSLSHSYSERAFSKLYEAKRSDWFPSVDFTTSAGENGRMLQFMHWGGPDNRTSVLKLTEVRGADLFSPGIKQNFGTSFFTTNFGVGPGGVLDNKGDAIPLSVFALNMTYSKAEFNHCLTRHHGGTCRLSDGVDFSVDAYCHPDVSGEKCLLHDSSTGSVSDQPCTVTASSCDSTCSASYTNFAQEQTTVGDCVTREVGETVADCASPAGCALTDTLGAGVPLGEAKCVATSGPTGYGNLAFNSPIICTSDNGDDCVPNLARTQEGSSAGS